MKKLHWNLRDKNPRENQKVLMELTSGAMITGFYYEGKFLSWPLGRPCAVMLPNVQRWIGLSKLRALPNAKPQEPNERK